MVQDMLVSSQFFLRASFYLKDAKCHFCWSAGPPPFFHCPRPAAREDEDDERSNRASAASSSLQKFRQKIPALAAVGRGLLHLKGGKIFAQDDKEGGGKFNFPPVGCLFDASKKEGFLWKAFQVWSPLDRKSRPTRPIKRTSRERGISPI